MKTMIMTTMMMMVSNAAAAAAAVAAAAAAADDDDENNNDNNNDDDDDDDNDVFHDIFYCFLDGDPLSTLLSFVTLSPWLMKVICVAPWAAVSGLPT